MCAPRRHRRVRARPHGEMAEWSTKSPGAILDARSAPAGRAPGWRESTRSPAKRMNLSLSTELQKGKKNRSERWLSGRKRSPAKGVRASTPSRVRIPLSPPYEFVVGAGLAREKNNAPVAQLDRVLGYEPSGREFESLRARQ